MKAGLLFSGGKDSSLAAVLLSRDYEVELNTFVFDKQTSVTPVEQAAEALGFPHHTRVFDTGTLDEVVTMIIRDGFPNGAIQMIHRRAIDALCEYYEVVGDGTRFGDRVPMLTTSEVQSISNRLGCSYVRPLLGLPKREVERLSSRHFIVDYGETGQIRNRDYEFEIRSELLKRGIRIENLFPKDHQQSLVTARRALEV